MNILLGMNWLGADNSVMTKEMLTKMKLKAMKVTILQETCTRLWEILQPPSPAWNRENCISQLTRINGFRKPGNKQITGIIDLMLPVLNSHLTIHSLNLIDLS